MAVGPVWFPAELEPLLKQLSSRTGGFPPIMDTIDENEVELSSSLHKPTLYPSIVVPKQRDANWGAVARSLTHLSRSLDGIPELRALGTSEDQQIARDINSELEWIAVAKRGVDPKPNSIKNLPQQISNYLAKDHRGTLPAHKVYQALRLLRLRLEGDRRADKALDLIREALPDETSTAESIFEQVLAEDLDTAAGKERATKVILNGLSLDLSKFFFHEYRFGRGVTEIRSLDYYSCTEAVEREFWSLIKPPFAWLQMQLPFVVPVLEGAYRLQNAAVLLRHVAIQNPRATWQIGEGTSIEAIMDPAGLYAQSQIQLILAGRLRVDDFVPPKETIYENIVSYPEVVHAGVRALNDLVNALRQTSGRCDIPDIVPAHFNKIAFRQIDEQGVVEKDIPSLSFELVKVSAGPPRVENEVKPTAEDVSPPSFQMQLLESAKLHVFETNARRAVIDLTGAFEAFVAETLIAQTGDLSEYTKQRFLRLYEQQLSESLKTQIEALSDNQDSKQPPSIYRVVKTYRRLEAEPKLEKELLDKVLKVYTYRNDAAHGRPIPDDALNDLIEAIPAFEKIRAGFNCSTVPSARC
ncbi:MAG: hypothetical protein IIC54_05345 [Proteobacteria bacterium]|nr:hypothetical protein [Pseudomonadota bacterium]